MGEYPSVSMMGHLQICTYASSENYDVPSPTRASEEELEVSDV